MRRALFLAALVLSACAAPAAPSALPTPLPGAAPLAAGPPQTVKVGIPNRGLSSLPLFVMQRRGLAAAEGLTLEVIHLRGGASVPALLNGEVDFNGGWGANTGGIRQGIPLKLVGF